MDELFATSATDSAHNTKQNERETNTVQTAAKEKHTLTQQSKADTRGASRCYSTLLSHSSHESSAHTMFAGETSQPASLSARLSAPDRTRLTPPETSQKTKARYIDSEIQHTQEPLTHLES